MSEIQLKLNRCVIFCASPEFFLCELRPDDYIIACDGGYAHARANGITPDFVLGDFDSYDGEIAPDIKTLRAPVEKDDTDAMLAIKLALDDGYRDFVLLGATGGRLDHQIANLSAAAYIARRGGQCAICDKHNTVHVLKDGELTLIGIKGQTVSVFSYTDRAEGVTLRGMKYPLENATLVSEFPLGASNVAQEDSCLISVKKGILMVIEAGWAH